MAITMICGVASRGIRLKPRKTRASSNCIKRLLTTKRRKLGDDGKNFLKVSTRVFDPE
jgi:hypothetical protein